MSYSRIRKDIFEWFSLRSMWWSSVWVWNNPKNSSRMILLALINQILCWGGQEVSCNVTTLRHHHSVEIYDDQSSHMNVIVSTKVIERHSGVQLALFIICHHYEPFRTGWIWFRCIPTISTILSILGYKLIKFT